MNFIENQRNFIGSEKLTIKHVFAPGPHSGLCQLAKENAAAALVQPQALEFGSLYGDQSAQTPEDPPGGDPPGGDPLPGGIGGNYLYTRLSGWSLRQRRTELRTLVYRARSGV